MKTTGKIAIVVVAVILVVLLALGSVMMVRGSKAQNECCANSTMLQEHVLELRTRSILLIDRSGSMTERSIQEQVIARLKKEKYDVISYFDSEVITKGPDYVGGGDSNICQNIDKQIDAGFTHISLVTDGQQWPEDYSALGVYSDVDITIYLVEESDAANRLVVNLSQRMVNSSLKVVTPDGEEKVFLNEYQPETYTIKVEVPVHECQNCGTRGAGIPWWLWLLFLPLALLPLLLLFFPFGGRKKEEEEEEEKPLEVTEEGLAAIQDSDALLLDCSGSMDKVLRAAREACKAIQYQGRPIIFGGCGVKSVKSLKRVKADGQTPGWEAMKKANEMGKKRPVIVTDAHFTENEVELSGLHFDKVTLVVTEGYSTTTVEEIRKIADEVEVLPMRKA